MPFTGVPGNFNAALGNFVLGFVGGFGPNSFQYVVHQLTSKTIRVAFDVSVDPIYALDPSSYSLSALNPPNAAYVPSIVGVRPYEEGGYQFELICSESLTFGQTYSIQISQMPSSDGAKFASAVAHNFPANVKDPPIPVRCGLSTRGCLDVEFDRPVGGFSPNPTCQIYDCENPSVKTSMLWVPWDSSMPSNVLRFQIPSPAPSSNEWCVDVDIVGDVSLNFGGGSVRVSIPELIPRPLSYLTVTQAQVVNAFTTNYVLAFGLSNVRVYFNCPMDSSSILNVANWSAHQVLTHRAHDSVNQVTDPDATNLVSLIALVNSIKSLYNKHLSEPGVHYSDDSVNIVNLPNATDAASAAALLNSLQKSFSLHASYEIPHSASDPVNVPQYVEADPINIPSCCSIANDVKDGFNGHLDNEYLLPITGIPIAGPIDANFSSYGSSLFTDEVGWSAEVRVLSSSPKAFIKINVSVQSEDLGSSTNPMNYTGEIIARPATFPASFLYSLSYPDEKVTFTSDRELTLRSGFDPIISESPSKDKIGFGYVRETSVRSAVWALTELWVLYDHHRTGQLHPVVDASNYMVSSDVPSFPLSSLLLSVNTLRDRFISHRTSSYHVHDDPYVFKSEPAYDVKTFVELVISLRNAFDAHSTNAGMHGGSSVRWCSAPLNDRVNAVTGQVKKDWTYPVRADLNSFVIDLRSEDYLINSVIVSDFVGCSNLPHVSGVIPRTGTDSRYGTDGFKPDELQVFFSKPMAPSDLSLISVTGGDLSIIGSFWVSKLEASVTVRGMQNATYSLSAVGLEDLAGNQIQ